MFELIKNKLIKNKLDLFRLIYAMILGYLISIKCKMNKNDGEIVKFRPSSEIFGIIWPILYILLGISWIIASRTKNKYLDIIYFILSSLLALWIIIYSCFNNKKNAIFILLFILLSISILMILSPQLSQLLLSPLAIWIFYATLLNTTEVQNLI